jgi:hypothetical protein
MMCNAAKKDNTFSIVCYPPPRIPRLPRRQITYTFTKNPTTKGDNTKGSLTFS